MPAALLGRKIGMTRYFLEDGENILVTVLQVGPCVITQLKSPESDGYAAVQIGFEECRAHRSTQPIIGHDAKAETTPKAEHREIRVEPSELDDFEFGKALDASVFEGVSYVDVIGYGKGKGFQGSMKRHNFKGLEASHGVKRRHRSPGSINGHATNLGTGPKIKRGKRMSGRMGNERVSARSMDVVAVDAVNNLLVVKGTVPGPNSGLVFVRQAVRLNRRKTRLAKAGS
jgi:large subunit ribosomal protein L3